MLQPLLSYPYFTKSALTQAEGKPQLNAVDFQKDKNVEEGAHGKKGRRQSGGGKRG